MLNFADLLIIFLLRPAMPDLLRFYFEPYYVRSFLKLKTVKDQYHIHEINYLSIMFPTCRNYHKVPSI